MENLPTWNVEQVWGSDRFYHEGDVAHNQIAFVIDSGISKATGDLNINDEWSKSFVRSDPNPFNDVTGHGTAVASVIGAKANYEGLTGVAPGAEVVALKVFGNSGRTATSMVNAALRHAWNVIKENNLEDRAVVNLSLGGLGEDRHPLVQEMADDGIRLTVAAGNSWADVNNFSPASYGDHPNVWTVSANDRNGNYSRFTNFDDNDGVDDVDFTAPGTGVAAYNPDGSIRSVNGTSFSAPHVAGLLLMSDIKAGQTFNMTEDQRNAGMVPDPLAMFDPDTYKHGSGTPDCPVPDPIYIEVPVPGPVVEVPIYIEVPGPVVEVPVPGPVVEVPVPQPITNFIGKIDERNKITGTEGDDIIIGGNLKDNLFGGAGNDWIMGQGDKDKIYGGAGADTFVLSTGKSFDIIKDFDPAEDILSLPEGELTATYRGNNTNLYVDGDLVARVNGTLTPETLLNY